MRHLLDIRDLTTQEIDDIVYDTTVRMGAIPAPLHYEGFPKSVCTSINEEVCHGIPDDAHVLQDGDTVVVFNPAHNKALSTNYTGFYNLGTDITVADGVVSGYTDAELWTLGINADGSYTFSTAAGKKLSMGASYTSTPLDDVNTAWAIEAAATEGCFYIKNVAREAYLEWFADKNNWSSYYNIGSNEALFAQQIYLVIESDEGGEDPDPEVPSGPIKDGDKVVIYAPAYNKALSATKTGNYNVGVDVTVSGDKLEGYGESEICTSPS